MSYLGQKSIRPYWRNYYDNTDALVTTSSLLLLAMLRGTAHQAHRFLAVLRHLRLYNNLQIYVIDSSDRRRVEEAGVELSVGQNLMVAFLTLFPQTSPPRIAYSEIASHFHEQGLIEDEKLAGVCHVIFWALMYTRRCTITILDPRPRIRE